MNAALADAWRMNCRVTDFLLELIGEEGLATPLAEGKSIRAQFAHLVNVRRMWLKMYARDLLDSEEKADRHRARRAELQAALASSAEAVAQMIERADSPDAKLKGARMNITAQAASFIAHEGYHRGQIELCLRQAGCELGDEQQIALWEWWKR